MIPFRFAFPARMAPRSGGMAPILLGLMASLSIPSGVRGDSTGVLIPAPEKDTAGSVLKLLENLEAKEGISMGGVFRGQFLNSSLRGPAVIPTLRSEESAEYTSVDFDLRARPNTATQGRLIFRMHQDWRNYFSDISNPIFTRWISLDGKVKGLFSYNAGDFRQRYSALTLYAPEINPLYEPEIFREQRQYATDEAFLGNNDRVLQGVNLNFDAAVDAKSGSNLLQELHWNLMGVRLRDVETNITNGDKVTSTIERAPAEKYSASMNTDATFLKGVSLGFTAMLIFDKKGTYNPSPGTDTLAQNTSISAGRAGLELGPILNAKNWSAGVSFETVLSQDRPDYFPRPGFDTLPTSKFNEDGHALLARAHGGWSTGDKFKLELGVNFLRNDSSYHNELAQTPTFVGERIMNIENDNVIVRTNDVRARNYSTFDAMYRTVFKFTPSTSTNMWAEAPFQKLSYNHNIMTQSEMRKFTATRVDTALQLVLPFGLATPNRTGVMVDLTAQAMGGNVEAKVLYSGLKNVTGTPVTEINAVAVPPDTVNLVVPVTDYSQMGGGLKLELGGLFGLTYPLTLAGSFIESGSKNDGIAGDTLYASNKVTSDFINAGLYYKFWKRAALMGGFQQIQTTITRGSTETKETEKNMAGGLEYRVAAGAYVSGTLGLIDVAYTGGAPSRDFSQLQTDLYLTVHF